MRLYRLRSRTGFTVYSDEGRDLKKFINALHGSSVRFFGLAVRGDRLYGYTEASSFVRLCEIAEEQGLICEKISDEGLPVTLGRYRHRLGIPLGLIISAVVVMLLSDRVMVIEVGGNETIPTERIMSHLESSGIYIGSSISSVDLRRAERQIAAMDRGIDWVGIKHIGSRVTVEINEMTSPPEMERKNTPCNIVASRDAQITGVKLYSGMLIPMVGDGVKKGEIIVSGVVDTKYGRSYYVHSIGEITGIYTERVTFSERLENEEEVCVGESVSRFIRIFGVKIPYVRADIPTGAYEYDERENQLTLFGFPLPVFKGEGGYRLYENRTVNISREEAERRIDKKISLYEKNFISGDEQILDRQTDKRFENGVLTCSVTYTIEGEIGEDRMILAKYESPERYDKSSEIEKS